MSFIGGGLFHAYIHPCNHSGSSFARVSSRTTEETYSSITGDTLSFGWDSTRFNQTATPDTNSTDSPSTPDQQTQSNPLKVAPNPFKNNFTVYYQVQQQGPVNLKVVNNCSQPVKRLHTQHVHKKGTYRLRVNANDLAPAVYLLVYTTPEQQQVKKIVKME